MTQPDLDKLKSDLLDAIAGTGDLGALEEVRVAALGKKGQISGLMKELGAMAPEDRRRSVRRSMVSRRLSPKRLGSAGSSLRQARWLNGWKPKVPT